jgi:hypothetical protein
MGQLAGADGDQGPVVLVLEAVTLWARSPSSRVAFHSSGPRRVREATYLGCSGT